MRSQQSIHCSVAKTQYCDLDTSQSWRLVQHSKYYHLCLALEAQTSLHSKGCILLGCIESSALRVLHRTMFVALTVTALCLAGCFKQDD